jgi:protein Tex
MLPLNKYLSLITEKTQCSLKSIEAVLKLSEEGNTIPFIARYRKEATGNIDEVAIQSILENSLYFVELEDRKNTILKAIESQDKLTDVLVKKITSCDNKSSLEDLYLPYKKRRKTRADIAKEKGLEPLADLLADPNNTKTPEVLAKDFVNEAKEVADTLEALKGARDVWAQRISDSSEIRQYLREEMQTQGVIVSTVKKDWREKSSKYEQYYTYSQKASIITSHAFLAIQRGSKEGVLTYSIEIDSDLLKPVIFKKTFSTPADSCRAELQKSIEDSLKRLLLPSIETQVAIEVKQRSDLTAVEVFSENITHLLLAAPFGQKSVLGIDPGWRTGCKAVFVDEMGNFINNWTLFPFKNEDEAKHQLLKIFSEFKPQAVAIGNGTAGRETLSFVQKALKSIDNPPVMLLVNESGASIYSASEVAREEFPDLDLTLRGSISIARRLQDPLAELVKIDPQSIGVGQYQHDVMQQLLHDRLKACVEFCVNKVGVELNSSSVTLLSYVSGLGKSLAKKILAYKKKNGKFSTRQELLKVPGLGPLAFEQSAGFLKISDSVNPLDSSSVHPESYPIVEAIAGKLNVSIEELIGNSSLLESVSMRDFSTDQTGSWTLEDIFSELLKPGRDPRSDFTPPNYRHDVMSMEDLRPQMQLEGVVTNVTAFGAFVDLGVHQDGLIHVSQLSNKFVSDPKEIVKTGQRVKVTVLEVDIPRKRISLTMKTQATQKATPPPVKKKANSPFANL